jgi:hypothetical protein
VDEMRAFLPLAAAIVATVAVSGAAGSVGTPAGPRGNVEAASDLLDRVLPGARGQFSLRIADDACASHAPVRAGAAANTGCFVLSDAPDGRVSIVATSASELTYGIGVYLRDKCGMTIGWPRGGASSVFIPTPWPKIGSAPLVGRRNVPWSYFMNVCTHSYSLVWYSWADWEQFIGELASRTLCLRLSTHLLLTCPPFPQQTGWRWPASTTSSR